MKTEINNKPIRIVNREAIRLAKLRAQREGRSASNAVAITVIEALGKKPQGGNPPGPDFLAKCRCKDTGGETGVSTKKDGL